MRYLFDRVNERLWLSGPALCLIATACATSPPLNYGMCPHDSSYIGAQLRPDILPSEMMLVPAGPSELSAADITRLDAAFDRALSATGARSMTAAVWQNGTDLWSHEHGISGGQLHYWASVGKIVTAATILRLQEDGRLSLDDSIAQHLDGVPNGDIITLRMLLNHTSGLFSANEDPDRQSGAAALTLAEEIEVLARRGPYSCPGAYWRYSNSGYALLGGVIERATGTPYHVAATNLVLSRSRAQNLRMIAPNDQLGDMPPLFALEGTEPFDPTHPQAAGGIIADAESMVIFVNDLFDGQILPLSKVRDMFDELYPMGSPGAWYGLGVMAYDVPGPKGSMLWLGHAGGVEGPRQSQPTCHRLAHPSRSQRQVTDRQKRLPTCFFQLSKMTRSMRWIRRAGSQIKGMA